MSEKMRQGAFEFLIRPNDPVRVDKAGDANDGREGKAEGKIEEYIIVKFTNEPGKDSDGLYLEEDLTVTDA